MINCNESLIPLSAVYGTYLNSRITCYDRLARRIAYQLGAPLVTLEVTTNAINEFISMAVERFSKFAGYDTEYLVFNSELYEPGKGIRLDVLFSLTPAANALYDNTQNDSDDIDLDAINNTNSLSCLSAVAYDYSLDAYRRVMDVSNFEQGESSGINTLFTLESSLAQQTYFAYSQGNYGFDLTTFYCLKEWLKLREKVLATLIDWTFNQNTQYLRLIPEPTQGQPYWVIVKCSIERSIKDLIKEPWVQDYALAISKISIARSRGKFSGTQLFGGGTVEWNTLLAEGLSEKKDLEEKLLTGTTPGWGDADPVQWFVG